MEELDYHPNIMAGSLRRKSTSTIGLIVPDNSNPFFAEVAKGIEDTGFKLGYSVMLCNSAYDFEREVAYINVLRSKRVDGLIIIPLTTEDQPINRLIDSKMPVIVVDRKVPSVKADAILVDNFRGSYEATEHLINLGHSRIGYIMRPFDLPHSIDRVKGYEMALEKHGIKPQKEMIVRGGFRYEDGDRAVQGLLALDPPVTAIVAFNDIIALGAIRAIWDKGLKVPQDISLVGFDDIPQASFTTPRLTTVSVPKYEMGEMATNLLMERINGTGPPERKEEVLETRLIIRETTQSPWR
jgi:LacI family transcriptional regulator